MFFERASLPFPCSLLSLAGGAIGRRVAWLSSMSPDGSVSLVLGPIGQPRVSLRAAGQKHGRKRIARLMRAAGIDRLYEVVQRHPDRFSAFAVTDADGIF
jgi:hypothetical protein